MTLILDFALIIIGLIGLFIGGEMLIRASSRLATALGVPTLIVGLTVVTFGTSTPELAISLSAALGGTSDLAPGDVIGSNLDRSNSRLSYISVRGYTRGYTIRALTHPPHTERMT